MKNRLYAIVVTVIVMVAVSLLLLTRSSVGLVAAEDNNPPIPTQTAPDDGQVWHGQVIEPHEYPSLIWILKDDQYFSAGILIDAEWVLTSAHNLFNENYEQYPGNQLLVIAGDHDLSNNTDGEIVVGVTQVIIHPGFGWEDWYDDIALIKLSSPIPEYEGHIEYAQLNFLDHDLLGDYLKVVGWGTNDRHSTALSNVARDGTRVVTNNSKCDNFDNGYFPTVIDQQYCVISDYNNAAGCWGDDGGPAYRIADNEQIVVGLMHIFYIGGVGPGFYTCLPEPSVHTRISAYHNWIAETTKRTMQKPVSLNPIGDETIATIDPLFIWEKDPGEPVQYEIQIKDRMGNIVFEGQVHKNDSQDGFSVCDDDKERCSWKFGLELPVDHNYSWQIRSRKGGFINSPWSAKEVFDVYIVPERPEQLAPLQNHYRYIAQPSLVWSAEPDWMNMEGYWVEVRTVDANQQMFRLFVDADGMCNQTECSYQVPVELSNGYYKWHVRPKNPGSLGLWTRWKTFYVADSINTPVLLSPAENGRVFTSNAEVKWAHDTGVDGYNVHFQNLDTLEEYEQYYLTSEICGPTTCSLSPWFNFPDGTYQWKVQSHMMELDSAWSEVRTLRRTPPKPPVLLYHIDNARAREYYPWLGWEPSVGAVAYDLEVYVVNTEELVYSRYNISSCKPTDIRCNTSHNPIPEGQFNWRMRAIGEYGPGPWGTKQTFRVDIDNDPPILVFPYNNAIIYDQVDTYFDWNISRYKFRLVYVEVYNDDTGDLVAQSGPRPSWDYSTQSQWNNKGYLSPGNYRWQVLADFDSIYTGYTTGFFYFTISVEPPPIMMSPIDGITVYTPSTEVHLIWEPALCPNCIFLYEIEIYDDTDQLFIAKTVNGAALTLSEANTPDYLPEGTYHWRIRSVYEDGHRTTPGGPTIRYSEWTEMEYFTVSFQSE